MFTISFPKNFHILLELKVKQTNHMHNLPSSWRENARGIELQG